MKREDRPAQVVYFVFRCKALKSFESKFGTIDSKAARGGVHVMTRLIFATKCNKPKLALAKKPLEAHDRNDLLELQSLKHSRTL